MSQFGTVDQVNIRSRKGGSTYGFIDFRFKSDAESAIDTLDGETLEGKVLTARFQTDR